MKLTSEQKWRLLALLDDAGAQLTASERQLLDADERIHRIGAIIHRVRGLAASMGIELSDPPPAEDVPKHMTVAEFASFMRWGEKRMRQLIRSDMIEGEHFHKNGTTYVVHVQTAQAFIKRRVPPKTIEVDELAAFRRKRRGSK